MKIRIALFFSIIFTTLLVAPTIISLADDSHEISIILDMNEEEENQGKESITDSEIKINHANQITTFEFNEIKNSKNIGFNSKIYFNKIINIDTPPPKFESYI